MKNFSLSEKNGFTILELLVTMTIILILSGILFLGKSKGQQELALQRSAYLLAQYLREVQEMAMAVREESCNSGKTYSFGAYFNNSLYPTRYFLFADCNKNNFKDASDKILREVNLESDVEIFDLSPSPLTVVFYPPDPITYINGSASPLEAVITLALKRDHQVQKKVRINTIGKIEIE